MGLELTGKVFKIKEEVTGEGRNGVWKKREFAITTDEEYPKNVAFTAWGDKADKAAKLKIDETIKVYFNAESREYNDRFYTDLRAWSIIVDRVENQTNEKPQEKTHVAPAATVAETDQDDDLPF
jgi:maltodextrin utilization protein YvdJ